MVEVPQGGYLLDGVRFARNSGKVEELGQRLTPPVCDQSTEPRKRATHGHFTLTGELSFLFWADEFGLYAEGPALLASVALAASPAAGGAAFGGLTEGSSNALPSFFSFALSSSTEPTPSLESRMQSVLRRFAFNFKTWDSGGYSLG